MARPIGRVTQARAWLVVAALATACSAPGATSGSDPSPMPSSIPTSSAASAPIPSLAEGEEFNEYSPFALWRFLAMGGPSGADDLSEAIALADTVVIGSMSSIERVDEPVGPGIENLAWYATATIDGQQVLAGRDPGPTITAPFVVVVGGENYPEKELYDLQHSMPGEPALLLLRSWQTYFDRSAEEPPEWIAHLDRDDRYRLIGEDGAIPTVDGVLTSPTSDDSWNRSLDGMLLGDVINEIVDSVP